MINKAIICGRLTKDVELRYTPTGKANAKVTVACQREFKNANGERESDFIQVECWGKTAELLSNHFKKGDVVGFEGPIRTGSYEGQDGKRVYTTNVYADSIKFIQGNNRNADNNGGQATYNSQPAYSAPTPQPTYSAPPQGAATQPQQQYSEEQVQAYLRQQQVNAQQQMVNEDPFAKSNAPIEVSDEDLPF
ncbi:single strand DNA binding protein [Lysinibacillus phage vB_LspM-01]|nr:single strand DNA binding protein [Lysinibacillus phage vB_LspM-01]